MNRPRRKFLQVICGGLRMARSLTTAHTSRPRRGYSSSRIQPTTSMNQITPATTNVAKGTSRRRAELSSTAGRSDVSRPRAIQYCSDPAGGEWKKDRPQRPHLGADDRRAGEAQDRQPAHDAPLERLDCGVRAGDGGAAAGRRHGRSLLDGGTRPILFGGAQRSRTRGGGPRPGARALEELRSGMTSSSVIAAQLVTQAPTRQASATPATTAGIAKKQGAATAT